MVDGLPQPQKAEFEKIPLTPKEPLKVECQHFLDSIKNSTKPLTDGLEGINVLKVLDASQISLIKGISVRLKSESQKKKDFYVHETACIDGV